jgi:hypothetical protein
MNDRIQQVLDGELGPEALTAAEREDLGRFEALMADLVRTVSPPEPGEVAPAVMARIRELEAGRAGTRRGRIGFGPLLSWLWAPRSLSIELRPASALATAALVLLFAGWLARFYETGPTGPNGAVASSERLLVEFRFHAPEALAVALAGDFTGWEPAYDLMPSGPGVWTVVVPLEPGVHDYAFIVDGERWLPDPSAPAVGDGFGGLNSRISVLAPDPESTL